MESHAYELLQQNRVISAGHQYTRPAAHVYPHQWLWDSCLHAVALARIEPLAARHELLSVVQAQWRSGPDAGMIPHMTYWHGGGRRLWPDDFRSSITQPPLIAVAAWLVFERTGDSELLDLLFEPLKAYHDWFTRRRDIHGDGLAAIIHPWESGWDASPRWDAELGWSGLPHDQKVAERSEYVSVLKEYDFDARQLAESGLFCVKPVDFNAIRCADLEALARAAVQLGRPAAELQEQAAAVREAVRTRLWLTDNSGFADAAVQSGHALVRQSASSFIALFGGAADTRQAQVLINDMCSKRYWRPCGIATSPRDCPDYSPGEYWRGNIWPSVTWLLWRGLLRYGRQREAQRLARQFRELVTQHGFHEYFNPETGAGCGPPDQSWTAIVLDMATTADCGTQPM